MKSGYELTRDKDTKLAESIPSSIPQSHVNLGADPAVCPESQWQNSKKSPPESTNPSNSDSIQRDSSLLA